ncbi:hypothetical protein V6N12_002026 [Hibiscus sabdariffa]|uniref:Uncharacterized protein n=1 Tax=Hibiscus sabdariffa TaxID=183260 RepID=A0ABR2B5Y1_9ROSI
MVFRLMISLLTLSLVALVRLVTWFSTNETQQFIFMNFHVTSLEMIIPNTRSFPYTFKSGLRSAIRVARVVKEAVDRNETGIRWFVFGDDDTIFVVDNLVKVFSKYDHDKWYYIGSSSESYEQNVKYSFGMVYSGGGFAISYSLGKVLARVLDSCLMRYGQLYGSDSRVVWLSLV